MKHILPGNKFDCRHSHNIGHVHRRNIFSTIFAVMTPACCLVPGNEYHATRYSFHSTTECNVEVSSRQVGELTTSLTAVEQVTKGVGGVYMKNTDQCQAQINILVQTPANSFVNRATATSPQLQAV
jgi:hypothetical protein